MMQFLIRKCVSLKAAGPRPCSRAALAIFKSASHDLNAFACARHHTQRGSSTRTDYKFSIQNILIVQQGISIKNY